MIYITFAFFCRKHTDNTLVFLFYFFSVFVTIGYSITLVQYILSPDSIFDEYAVNISTISATTAECALVGVSLSMFAAIHELTLKIKVLLSEIAVADVIARRYCLISVVIMVTLIYTAVDVTIRFATDIGVIGIISLELGTAIFMSIISICVICQYHYKFKLLREEEAIFGMQKIFKVFIVAFVMRTLYRGYCLAN